MKVETDTNGVTGLKWPGVSYDRSVSVYAVAILVKVGVEVGGLVGVKPSTKQSFLVYSPPCPLLTLQSSQSPCIKLMHSSTGKLNSPKGSLQELSTLISR